MAIRIEQPGLAGLYGQLAILAGKSIQARKESEIAERMAERISEMEHQKQLRLLDRQWQLETESRARNWELEKMEIRSRTDFAEEERIRIKKKRELESKLEAIDKSDELLSAEEKQLMKLQIITGVPVYSMLQRQKPASLSDIFAQQIAAGSAGGAGSLPGVLPGTLAEPKTEAEYNALPSGTQYIHPDGDIRTKK